MNKLAYPYDAILHSSKKEWTVGTFSNIDKSQVCELFTRKINHVIRIEDFSHTGSPIPGEERRTAVQLYGQ